MIVQLLMKAEAWSNKTELFEFYLEIIKKFSRLFPFRSVNANSYQSCFDGRDKDFGNLISFQICFAKQNRHPKLIENANQPAFACLKR